MGELTTLVFGCCKKKKNPRRKIKMWINMIESRLGPDGYASVHWACCSGEKLLSAATKQSATQSLCNL